MGLFHLAWFSPVPSLLQSGRKFSKYALLSSSLSMYLNFCEIPVFFCWQCCFLWKVLIVFFIFHFNTSYHTVTELNKGLVFLHCPLSVAFISCFLDYLYRKMMDWNRPVECRAKIIAQSNGLSVLKIKSWFTDGHCVLYKNDMNKLIAVCYYLKSFERKYPGRRWPMVQ